MGDRQRVQRDDDTSWGGKSTPAWDVRHAGVWGGEDRRTWDGNVWGWTGDDRPGTRNGEPECHRGPTGGAGGNERLTALTGTVLLVLFAVEGFTVLAIHRLLTLHFFLGLLLIGPVALKVCSVAYRFVRYYTGAEDYRRKGPPAPLPRVLGPVVLVTSVSVIATGVLLAVTGPSGAGTWLFLHKASFVLWFCAMAVHVLTYVWRLPRLVSADLVSRVGKRASEVLAGRLTRWLLLTASLLTGVLLAVLTVHSAGAWQSFFSGPR